MAKEEKKTGGNTGLPYGLCKKYGITLPEDATPKQAWAALIKEKGVTPEKAYGELEAKSDKKKSENDTKESPKKKSDEAKARNNANRAEISNKIRTAVYYENSDDLKRFDKEYVAAFHEDDPQIYDSETWDRDKRIERLAELEEEYDKWQRDEDYPLRNPGFVREEIERLYKTGITTWEADAAQERRSGKKKTTAAEVARRWKNKY